LIKASNGASDFGNKFGQPLIAGSILTFEHQENGQKWGYDKVIMLAGGVGMGIADQALKAKPSRGDLIVILGGDNYRIGMGGAAVSSVNTGTFDNTIELNAVQRSNPEMQKRVANTIRALVETGKNPIVSIHDHGAGGHLNCLSELVEETGGTIYINKLPLGDPTLSSKEIIGNESQERMGLIINPKDQALLERIAARERSPIYIVGKVTEDHMLSDVPIGSLLSGGLDSSLLTVLMKKDKIKTFSASFNAEGYDESEYATLISNQIKRFQISICTIFKSSFQISFQFDCLLSDLICSCSCIGLQQLLVQQEVSIL
jgi:phosphoribosylformylglycinamidine synthase